MCIGIFVLLFCVFVVFMYCFKYIQTKPLNGVLNKGCMIKLDLHVHYKFFTAYMLQMPIFVLLCAYVTSHVFRCVL